LSERTFPFAPSSNGATDTDIVDRSIDMSPYCQQTSDSSRPQTTGNKDVRKKSCSDALLQQLQADGFALVRGTGISGHLCREALRLTHSFLHDADESVRRSCLSVKDRARRGYSPINTENFASLLGEVGPNDLVRKFRMGPPNNSSASHSSSLLQPNIWPSPEHWDASLCQEFQATLEEYYDKICIVANAIVHCICDGLLAKHEDLALSLESLSTSRSVVSPTQEQENDNAIHIHNTSILTMLGYQTGSRHNKKHQKKKREIHPLVAAHTDVGVITVLLYDGGDCAVLQRQTSSASGEMTANDSKPSSKMTFQDVILPSQVPEDPIFVVNIGDCLASLSHSRLPSTIHRVVPRDGTIPRNCLALFVGFDPNQTLRLENGEVVSYETWRKNRIAASQTIRRSIVKS
jgi:isopenicillin N synthase-like dioxygenase